MAAGLSIIGLLVILVICGLVLAAVLIPVIIAIRHKMGAEEMAPGQVWAVVGSCGALAFIGFLVVGALIFFGLFFHVGSARRAPMRPPMPVAVEPLPSEAPKPLLLGPEKATGAAEIAEPSPRPEPPPPVQLQLSLRRAEGSVGLDGRFVLEIHNQRQEPVSPSSLIGRSSNLVWHVEILGKAVSSRLTWDQADFAKEIPAGDRGVCRIQAPLEEIGAKPGDEVRVCYKTGAGEGELMISSNKVQLPAFQDSGAPEPGKQPGPSPETPAP